MSSSSIDPTLPPLKPSFQASDHKDESLSIQALIEHLDLQKHPGGGYFVETDCDSRTLTVPPWKDPSNTTPTHNASTTIHYLLTRHTPLGHFHRHRARTIHTLHRGRGRYVIMHADEVASPACPSGDSSSTSKDIPESERWVGKARIETFVVGQDVLKGERVQWIVEGGKYKTSYLLPDSDESRESEGLLISETVVPGFEFGDHDFLREERLKALVEERQAEEMGWMLRRD